MQDKQTISNVTIAWQQQIDLYSEELVEMADNTLSETRMTKIKRNMRTSQLANFLGVALEAEGVAPVNNWVHYQMGRRETSRAWQDSNFGADVQKDMKKIKEFATTIADEVWPEAEGMIKKRHIQKTHIALVRLYAGYLKRWFVARGGQN